MGYVGQEPVLFAGSIAENIAYGLGKSFNGTQYSDTVRMNANEYIVAFPLGYDTDVGANEGSMSGV
jgi:ABC-type multidrug transport system fused ATPase/permease subunit